MRCLQGVALSRWRGTRALSIDKSVKRGPWFESGIQTKNIENNHVKKSSDFWILNADISGSPAQADGLFTMPS